MGSLEENPLTVKLLDNQLYITAWLPPTAMTHVGNVVNFSLQLLRLYIRKSIGHVNVDNLLLLTSLRVNFGQNLWI